MNFDPSPKIKAAINKLKDHELPLLAIKAYEVWQILDGRVNENSICKCFNGLVYRGDLMDDPNEKTNIPNFDMDVSIVTPGREPEYLEDCLYSSEEKLKNLLLFNWVPNLLAKEAQEIGCETNVTGFNGQEGVSIKQIIETLCNLDMQRAAEINSNVINRIRDKYQEEYCEQYGPGFLEHPVGRKWPTEQYRRFVLEELEEFHPDLFTQLISRFPQLKNQPIFSD